MFSQHFQYNERRIKLIESLAEEYLNILAILYGSDIESGTKQLKDFGHMTMLDAEQELKFRTIMMRAQFTRKQRELRAEYSANEQAMLEELKRASQ